MSIRIGWRRRVVLAAGIALLAASPIVVPQIVASASAAPTTYIPEHWAATGEVPWVQQRTRESANFILLRGDRSGTDPKAAPAPYRFDPDDILAQLEKLFAATYRLTGQWQGGFQAEVTVRAGGAAINGWQVGWSFPAGQTVSQSWGGTVTASGAATSVQIAPWNGAIAAAATTTFGFIGAGTR